MYVMSLGSIAEVFLEYQNSRQLDVRNVFRRIAKVFSEYQNSRQLDVRNVFRCIDSVCNYSVISFMTLLCVAHPLVAGTVTQFSTSRWTPVAGTATKAQQAFKWDGREMGLG